MDAPFGHWGTQTFIAGPRCHGLIAPWVIDKAINRPAFDTWVETQLAPTLSRGDIVILDNLAVHKSVRRTMPQGHRRLVPVPAALQSRPQSDRDGFLQTQGASARRSSQNLRRPLEDRQHLRPLQPRRVLELSQAGRICVRLNVRRSNEGTAEITALIAGMRMAKPRDGYAR